LDPLFKLVLSTEMLQIARLSANFAVLLWRLPTPIE
jgi:hypothetical protein